MTQSRTLAKILREAKRLRPVDRRKLIRALEKDQPQPRADKRAAAQPVLERFIARAGTGHSRFTDVSTDKYEHLGEAYRLATFAVGSGKRACAARRCTKRPARARTSRGTT
jgi:hypothetical protein